MPLNKEIEPNMYIYKNTQYKYTGDSVIEVRKFINFWTFFDTRRKRQFLKVFRIILYKQNSQLPGRTPTSQHHDRTPTSTVGLNGRERNCLLQGPMLTFQLTLFQNLQILTTIASGQDVIHTPAPFPIGGLLWQLWLSYPLRASVNCTQCLCAWTKSRIVQSPTKVNDKI